jgi:hypothetical protein
LRRKEKESRGTGPGKRKRKEEGSWAKREGDDRMG